MTTAYLIDPIGAIATLVIAPCVLAFIIGMYLRKRGGGRWL